MSAYYLALCTAIPMLLQASAGPGGNFEYSTASVIYCSEFFKFFVCSILEVWTVFVSRKQGYRAVLSPAAGQGSQLHNKSRVLDVEEGGEREIIVDDPDGSFQQAEEDGAVDTKMIPNSASTSTAPARFAPWVKYAIPGLSCCIR